jgi:hypothetical protein
MTFCFWQNFVTPASRASCTTGAQITGLDVPHGWELENKKDEAPKELRPSKNQIVETIRLVTALAAIAAAATTEAATAFAAAAAAETTSAAAEAATWALFFWTGFIDGELATTEIGAVKFFCCGLRLIGGAHGDERETAGAAGHLVHGYINVSDRTELAKS